MNYYPLPTPHYPLPTTYFLLSATDYLLPTTYYRLPTTYRLYLLPTTAGTLIMSFGLVWALTVHDNTENAADSIWKARAQLRPSLPMSCQLLPATCYLLITTYYIALCVLCVTYSPTTIARTASYLLTAYCLLLTHLLTTYHVLRIRSQSINTYNLLPALCYLPSSSPGLLLWSAPFTSPFTPRHCLPLHYLPRLHLQPATYNLQPTCYNLQPTIYNIQPTPYNLHPTTYILHPTSYILHPTTYYYFINSLLTHDLSHHLPTTYTTTGSTSLLTY